MSTPCKCFIPSWPNKFYCQWIGSVFISGHRINIFPWFIMKSEISCNSALLVNQVVEFTVFSQLAFCCSFLTISTINTNHIPHFCAQSYSFGDKHLKTDTTKDQMSVIFLYWKQNLPKKKQKQKNRKKGSKTRSEAQEREDSVAVIFLCFPLLCTTRWKCLTSRFMEDVNTKQRLSFSFPEPPFRQLPKNFRIFWLAMSQTQIQIAPPS